MERLSTLCFVVLLLWGCSTSSTADVSLNRRVIEPSQGPTFTAPLVSPSSTQLSPEDRLDRELRAAQLLAIGQRDYRAAFNILRRRFQLRDSGSPDVVRWYDSQLHALSAGALLSRDPELAAEIANERFRIASMDSRGDE
jgi:hypothetical protein